MTTQFKSIPATNPIIMPDGNLNVAANTNNAAVQNQSIGVQAATAMCPPAPSGCGANLNTMV